MPAAVELAMQEIAGANRKRQWMATDNNPRSSRTHLIHTLALVTSVRSPTGAWRLAKSRVHLVDLAGGWPAARSNLLLPDLGDSSQ